MAVSILRRYTPPTCTLEISGSQSPLSRWANRPVLRNVRFRLNFDDPRLPQEQHATLEGDRDQLSALCDTVQDYVQNLLKTAPAQFNSVLLSQSAVEESPNSDLAEMPIERATASSNALHLAANDAAEPNSAEPDTAPGIHLPDDRYGLRLAPKGLLEHTLHLGELATDRTGDTVNLSTLQLFDLSNALDGYTTDALALPDAGRSGWLQSTPGWARIAAMLLAAVGVTTFVTRFVMDVSSPTYETATAPQSGIPNNAAIGESAPLPPADSFALPPDASTLPASPTGPIPTVPPPPQGAFPLPTFTPQPVAPPAGSANVPIFTIPEVPAGAPAQVPAAQRRPVPQIQPLPPLAPVAPPANAPQNAPQVAAAPRAQISQIELPIQTNTVPGSDRPTAREGFSPGGGAAPANADGVADGITFSGQAPSGVTTAPFEAAQGTQTAARSTARPVTPTQAAAEVQRYFRDRWQPPQSLDQTLEYRLVLNPDGTVGQIIPLGDQAGNYVDRTGIPLVGEPFVSPLENGQRALVRLVLSPDRSVQTFVEPIN